MSKSILLMDTPEKCIACRFHIEILRGKKYCCKAIDNPKDRHKYRVIDVDAYKLRPDWCPLQEIPKKNNLDHIEKYVGLGTDYCWSEGYNACIDEILKEGTRRNEN